MASVNPGAPCRDQLIDLILAATGMRPGTWRHDHENPLRPALSLFVLLSAITGLAYPWPRHRHCRGSLPGTGQLQPDPPGWQARRSS
jgi:hypothetical protein